LSVFLLNWVKLKLIRVRWVEWDHPLLYECDPIRNVEQCSWLVIEVCVCLCVYVCVSVCACVCVYVRVCVCMCVDIDVRMYVCV